ncbi:hypothetical protein A3838_18800 [Streptomyces badius]|nr:hypothetical protein A3838_18800 [Streptomyces badius]
MAWGARPYPTASTRSASVKDATRTVRGPGSMPGTEGTASRRHPAARAAEAPVGVSSTARQSCGATPSAGRRGQVRVGVRLSARRLARGDRRVEAVPAQGVQHQVGHMPLRRGHQGRRYAEGARPVQEPEGARLDGHPGRHPCGELLVEPCERFLRGQRGEAVAHEAVGRVGQGGARERGEGGRAGRGALRPQEAGDGVQPGVLGVDEGAVHVAEQGGGAGERGHAGLAVPGSGCSWGGLFRGWLLRRGRGASSYAARRAPSCRQSAAVRTSGLACTELRTVKTTEPGR